MTLPGCTSDAGRFMGYVRAGGGVNLVALAVETAALTDTTETAADAIDATAITASGRCRRREDVPGRDVTL